jgi:hypothetical protein
MMSLMKTYGCKSALMMLICLCAAAAASAQNGGKAEPLRIEFKRGATSATLNDRISGDAQAEYIFAAREGQRLTIKLASTPVKSALFELRRDDGDSSGVEYEGSRLSKIVTQTGDYLIYVKRSSRTRGRSNYSLTLTIKGTRE